MSLPQRRHAHVEGDGGHDSAAVNTISTRTILIAITNMLAIGIFAVIISTTLKLQQTHSDLKPEALSLKAWILDSRRDNQAQTTFAGAVSSHVPSQVCGRVHLVPNPAKPRWTYCVGKTHTCLPLLTPSLLTFLISARTLQGPKSRVVDLVGSAHTGLDTVTSCY